MQPPARLLSRFAAAVAFVATLFCAVATAHAAAILAHGYTMVGDASRMRIILYFDQKPEPRSFLLRNPYRLVIDFPATSLGIDPQATVPRGLVAAVHYGRLDSDISRIVLVAGAPFAVESLSVGPNENSVGYRMVLDIVAATQESFDAALAKQANIAASVHTTPKQDRLGTAVDQHNKRFTIVIDPGHGGIDSGTEGVAGTLEKTITLAVGLELREKLNAEGNYDVYMTRDDDTYVSLDDRVAFAREHSADLMISIHADSIHLPGMRGATIYTGSDKASDAQSAALAARENLSDELAGMNIDDDNHAVSDILLDLVKRETFAYSMRFARSLVGELSQSINLVNNPHRYAGFRVLEAPDVPSVLLELGYLSNKKDESDLRDPDWREKAVDGLVAAIDRFVAARAGG